MAFDTDTGQLGSAAVGEKQVAVVGTLATDPFLPGKFAEMAAGTNGNKTNRLPATAASRPFNPLRVQIEAAHLAGPGVAIPPGETLPGNIQHGVGRAWRALSDVAVIRRRAKAVHVKQRGQARLDPLKLGAVLAAHQTEGLVGAHEPVVETTHDVRHTTPVGVKTPRAERGDDLADSNLLVCHSRESIKSWAADCRAEFPVRLVPPTSPGPRRLERSPD